MLWVIITTCTGFLGEIWYSHEEQRLATRKLLSKEGQYSGLVVLENPSIQPYLKILTLQGQDVNGKFPPSAHA
jgi:hypothetical protein